MKNASIFLAFCLLASLPAKGAPAAGKMETPVLAPIATPAATAPSAAPKRTAAPANSNTSVAPLTLSSPVRDSVPRINCVLPVQRVGSVQLDDGQAVIRNGLVEIRSRFTTGQAEPYLSGHVIKQDDTATSDGAGGLRKMSGIVLFHGGMMLSQLTDLPPQIKDQSLQTLQAIQSSSPLQSVQSELVFRNDGSGSISGQIVDIRAGQLLMKDRTGLTAVPLSSISYLRSPRAFIFTILGKPASDQSHTTVQNISFQPTLNSSGLQDQLVVGKPADPLDDYDELAEPLMPRNKPLVEEAQWQQPLPGRRAFPNWP